MVEFKSNLYVKVITLPGFQTAFSGVFSTAVDISDDEGGMAMDIHFKLGTKQRNRWHKTAWTFRKPRIKETQNHIQVTCIITASSSYFLFQFYFTPENPS